MSLLNYLKAVSVGKTHVGIIRATWSVARARIFFGIGPTYHSSFRLFNVPASEWNSYVSEAEVNKITGKLNGKTAYSLARSKTAFYQHCLRNDIPTVPILGEIGGQGQDGIKPVSNKVDFDSLLDSAPPVLFFKTSSGAHGDGAFRATRLGEQLWSVKDKSYTAEELYDFVLNQYQPGQTYLVQPAVRPHRQLAEIMPRNALGTVRIITWLENDNAKALQPVLRIPANGNVTDNFSLGLIGNLVAPIDLDSGKLGLAKGSLRRDWPAIFDVVDHPDTGGRIEGRVIPFWQETVELALAAQRKSPQLPNVGWDIAITDDGPLVIETNTLYGVGTFQTAHGRGARSSLDQITKVLS